MKATMIQSKSLLLFICTIIFGNTSGFIMLTSSINSMDIFQNLVLDVTFIRRAEESFTNIR